MTKVKFKKIKKRKVLETWQHKNRKTGLVSYIYCSPNNNYYYFTILCFIKRCGRKECIKKCDLYMYYNSLDESKTYSSFDECRNDVIQWHKRNNKV